MSLKDLFAKVLKPVAKPAEETPDDELASLMAEEGDEAKAAKAPTTPDPKTVLQALAPLVQVQSDGEIIPSDELVKTVEEYKQKKGIGTTPTPQPQSTNEPTPQQWKEWNDTFKRDWDATPLQAIHGALSPLLQQYGEALRGEFQQEVQKVYQNRPLLENPALYSEVQNIKGEEPAISDALAMELAQHRLNSIKPAGQSGEGSPKISFRQASHSGPSGESAPMGGDERADGLTPKQREHCKKRGLDPKEYAVVANKFVNHSFEPGAVPKEIHNQLPLIEAYRKKFAKGA